MPRRPASARLMPKIAANVSVRRDLLEASRAAGLNISATLEEALIGKLKDAQQRQWRDENRESIAAYNDHVATHGVFSDGSRGF